MALQKEKSQSSKNFIYNKIEVCRPADCSFVGMDFLTYVSWKYSEYLFFQTPVRSCSCNAIQKIFLSMKRKVFNIKSNSWQVFPRMGFLKKKQSFQEYTCV